MTAVENKIYIDAPLKKVLDFSSNPENWAKIQVGLSDAEVITGTGDVGTRAKLFISLLGKKFQSLAEIIEKHIDDQGCKMVTKIIIDFAGKEYESYSIETGVPKGSGCEYTQLLEYKIPDNFFAKIVDNLILEKMMEKDNAHTLENLKIYCEALK